MEIVAGGIVAGVVILVALAFLVFIPNAAGYTPPNPVDQPPPSKPVSIEETIRRAAAANGEDAALMLAIGKTESNLNPAAVNPSDPSYGLFQIQTFWLKAFGYPNDKSLLLDPVFASNIAAQILQYFRGRVNPQTGDYFQFPAEIDIYNVGESKWALGVRNAGYRNLVMNFYKQFGGQA